MTAQEQTKRFLRLIESLVPGSKPVLLQHAPEPDARPNNCFANCKRKANISGGAMQSGWIFIPGGHFFIAISHAVWRSPENVLIDVTPSLFPLEGTSSDIVCPIRNDGHLLFLPDDKAFEAPSRYFPLSKNKALVRACRRWNRKEWQVYHDPEAMAKLDRELAMQSEVKPANRGSPLFVNDHRK